MKNKYLLETKALKLTILGNLVWTVLGVAIALWTDSEAILLDGLFSMIGMIVSLVSLRVSRLIRQPDDDRYHFGYSALEPVLNFIKGILIALVLVFAFTTSVNSIMEGGRVIAAGIGATYALIAALGCWVLGIFVHRLARQSKSPIVAIDAKNWLLDGAISLVVAVAFFIVILIKGTRYEGFIPYVDPGVVLLIVVLASPIPFKIIRDYWRQLTGRSPQKKIQDQVEQIVNGFIKEVPIKDSCWRTVEVGRMLYVQLYLVLDPKEGEQFSLMEQDQLRAKLYERLINLFPNLSLDVIFTGQSTWIRRSIGSFEDQAKKEVS